MPSDAPARETFYDRRPDGGRPRPWWRWAAGALGAAPAVALWAWLAAALGPGQWPTIVGALGPLFLIGVLGARAAFHWRRRTALRADARGISELSPLGRLRLTPWDAIDRVDWRDDGLTIHRLDGQFVDVSETVESWRWLGRRAAEACGVAVPEPTGGLALSDAEVLERLGLEGRVGRYPLYPAGLLVVMRWIPILMLPGFLGALASGDWQSLVTMVACLIGPLVSYWSLGRTPHELVVDAAGIELRYPRWRRFVPWAEVQTVRRDRASCTLHTGRGDVVLSTARGNLAELCAGIERLLTARDEGLALPRLGAVPESALSAARADGAADGIERGLSASGR